MKGGAAYTFLLLFCRNRCCMAGPWKLTMFFRREDAGWSESVLSNAGTIFTASADAVTLGTARLNCLLQTDVMEAIRISDINVFRDSHYEATIGLPANGNFAIASGAVAPVRVCINQRIEAGLPHRRIYALRSLPKVNTNGNDYVPGGAGAPWNAVRAAYVNLFNAPGNTSFGAQLFTPTVPTDFPAQSVSGLGVVQYPGPLDPAIVAASFLKIRGIRGIAPNPNKTYRIAFTDSIAHTVTLLGWNRPVAVGPFLTNPVALGFALYNQAILGVLDTRKTGKPFFLLRGRRSRAR
jgi:hypothetical protein